MRFMGSYLNYREEVRDLVIRAGGYASPEWFASQSARITRAFLFGESPQQHADTLAAFGRGAMVRKSKSPRELAVRVVRVP